MRILIVIIIFLLSNTGMISQHCDYILTYGPKLAQCTYFLSECTTLTLPQGSYLKEIESNDNCAEITLIYENRKQVTYYGILHKNFIINSFIDGKNKKYIKFGTEKWDSLNSPIVQIIIKSNQLTQITIINDDNSIKNQYTLERL